MTEKFILFIKKSFSLLLGFTILVSFCYGVFQVIAFFFYKVSTLNNEIATAIIVAATSILVSVITVVLGKYYEKKKKLEFEIREKKIPVYENFLNFTFAILNQELEISTDKKSEFQKKFMKLTQELLVWGSDDVIKKWIEYRKNATKGKEVLPLLEDLFFAIRKDTGHKNKNLKRKDLLSLFLNDLHKTRK